MEENEQIREQPQEVQTSPEETTEGSLNKGVEVDGQTGEAERGVPIGKFKSVEDLLSAYNNLEAEFTRKSQRLACLEQEKANFLSNKQPLHDEDARLFLEKLKDGCEPDVQNIILQDEELSNLVIQNYMKQLQEQKKPIVMSSNAGERVTRPVMPKPDTFEEAKKVVLNMLS